jgi:hypothetical protein
MSGRGSKVSSLSPASRGNQKYMCSSLSLNCSPFPILTSSSGAADGRSAGASAPFSPSPAAGLVLLRNNFQLSGNTMEWPAFTSTKADMLRSQALLFITRSHNHRGLKLFTWV